MQQGFLQYRTFLSMRVMIDTAAGFGFSSVLDVDQFPQHKEEEEKEEE